MKSMKMTPKMKNLRNIAATLVLGLALTGCGGKKESGAGKPAPADAEQQIEAVLLKAEPEGAVGVAAARQSAKPGDTIVVTGRVAGADQPFTEGYAVVVLGDDALQTCERIPGDECETPWDACCEDPDKIKASRISVQVLGEDGRPAARSLKGVGGIKELDTLVVKGTVADSSSADNLILTASGIFRKTP